jgi:hypothetical protein
MKGSKYGVDQNDGIPIKKRSALMGAAGWPRTGDDVV